MNRGVFKRIFILYAVLILLAFLFVEVTIASAIREHYLAGLKQNLSVQASLIADSISFDTRRSIDVQCKQLKEKTGARVTVIELDGRVIGDSDSSSSTMENHAHRPEIQQAALNGAGMFIRSSDTLKQDFLYVAHRVDSGKTPRGYIRLSVPLQDVDHAVNAARLNILLIVGFVLAATGLFSLWQFEYLRRLTREINDFARSLVPRGIGNKLHLKDAGEFSDIADSLNAMSMELKTVIGEHEEERKRLNEILRSIPDALIIMDSNGVVLLSSAASGNFFGDTPLMGRPFIQVVRNSEFFSLLDEVRTSRKAGVSEFKIEYPAERYCIVRISPLFHDRDVLTGFVAIFHDITELKKMEQVRKDFVANASHEIKTPITAIKGFADTLLEGALDDKEHAVKFLKSIQSNSERINSLVDDLMTISKIEMGVVKIDKASLGFVEVAKAVQELLKEKAGAKNLSLKIFINPDMNEIVADRDRLTQIVTNLVENGIKFTDQGGVTFGMDKENGKAVIFVEDTGIGIPKQHLSRIGERFYRVDAGRSRQMGGTGLGLAIVKHLVKAHGWDMQIESTLGKGTKVKIFVV
ncbi:MAG: ATP-binding protein [Nitrospirae bacterium]|nr:ATP-binding protein [Nitrospirota bacterium]